jgi:predicted  nucleic acid-binding Zn-ribbon protein
MTELDAQMAHKRQLLSERKLEDRLTDLEMKFKVLQEEMRGAEKSLREQMSDVEKTLKVMKEEIRGLRERQVRLSSVVEKLELIFSYRNPEMSLGLDEIIFLPVLNETNY